MSLQMSRGKLRSVTEVCADCGALDPSWASINRGILLCDECCSIHRSLGRHISQVKSLKKGSWSPTLLQMVHTLNNSGVNSIWEHSLLDPTNSKSGRRKPQPKDPIHPTKAEFIRAKHQMLAFVFRPGKDDTVLLESDLSKQLHSSVRTTNLETSLRLLSQGADPNYFHEEKGTTPLHVAAKAGQMSQMELLAVYGADPGAFDNNGKTPIDYAKSSGHKDLADRLTECMYELTDRLAYYLCSRKPDHLNGQHYIIPEMSDSLELTELAKTAKKKLQQLPNHLFEELAMDVYDEVDRRETETIWLSMQQATNALAIDRCAVPFLPVNPEFSSTRNQGRQKLARFNAREFAMLIIDILSDAKRRQSPSTSSLILSHESRDILSSKLLKGPLMTLSAGLKRKSEISDDEPLYDSVASDEDYVSAEQMAVLTQQTAIGKIQDNKDKRPEKLDEKLSMEKGDLVENKNGPVSDKTEVNNLILENRELRRVIQNAGLALPTSASPVPNGHDPETENEPVLDVKSPRSSSQRPASMYEPREGLLYRSGSSLHCSSVAANMGKWDKFQHKKDGIMNEYDSPSSLVRPVMTQSLYQCVGTNSEGFTRSCSGSTGMPLSEEVVRRTDQVTKRIQELWTSMQDPEKRDAFVPCAERIRVAVAELTAIFPQNPPDEHIRTALRQLNSNTGRLQTECAGLQKCTADASQVAERAFFLQQVRSCAYDIAKATKQLVTKFQL
ncbi:ARF GTPase-activating protein GIT2 isoform X2 [Anabrus simplex]|uniref:ARF GTPase-activating protein GIT2 isoform X2 n=1 Tax=Anabrus simplex TaxID=316456 RepID=UPI0035A30DD2